LSTLPAFVSRSIVIIAEIQRGVKSRQLIRLMLRQIGVPSAYHIEPAIPGVLVSLYDIGPTLSNYNLAKAM
jgi:hypothetical protein